MEKHEGAAMHPVEWLRRGLIVLLMLCAAQVSGADEVQPVPRVTTRVTDVPGLIPEARRSALEAKLERLEKERSLYIGIVLVASIRPETPEAYGARVVDAWRSGVTGGKDGVLLMVARDEGRVFLDVGRGRTVVPYKEAMRSVMGVVAPHFQRGDFATGIDAGINALVDHIDAAGGSKTEKSEKDGASVLTNVFSGASSLQVLALVGATVAASVLGRLVGRLLAGVAGGCAAAYLVWTLVPVTWTVAVCGALVFFVALGTSPGKSLRVLGPPSDGAGGTVGASGDWT